MANNFLYNEPAERAVLGQLLFERDCWDKLDTVCDEDLYLQIHKDLLFAMKINANDGDVVSIIERGRRAGKDINEDYVFTLLHAVVTCTNFDYYVQVLKDYSYIRRAYGFIKTMEKHIQQNRNPEFISKNFEDFLQNQITQDATLMPISDIVSSVYTDISTREKLGGKIVGLLTGFNRLDLILGGLQKGSLVVIGARPSVGKSAFAGNILQNVCIKKDGVGIFFNLEMSKESIVKRMLSSYGAIDNEKIKRATLEQDDYERLIEATTKLSLAKLVIDDKPAATMGDIRKTVRAAYRKYKKIDLIVVDYLQLMEGSELLRREKVENNSRQLKALAKEYDCVVIALSQLSRAIEQRGDSTPTLSDLREAGGIEQDADIILFLSGDKEDKTKKTLNIAKNRDGKLGEKPLYYDGKYFTFLEPER